MRIRYEDIIFDNQLVLNGSTIQIEPSLVTIVTGESGSGKTSLLKSIYHNARKKKKFYSCYSFSFQEGLFIDDLTIEDHFKMIQELTESDVDLERYTGLLSLNDVKSKYPLQLSGGEKKRVSFLLTVLKNTQYFLLDEPTASLNEEYTEVYIEIIRELQKRGKGFLIFTHDEELTRIGDIRYHIADHTLQVIKETAPKDSQEYELKKNCDSIHKILSHKDSHRKLYQKVISAFMAFSIAFICYTGGLSNATYSAQQRIIESMDSNQITVFKPCATYVFDGVAQYSIENEVPFTDEEINQIKNLEHVKRMEWRFDYDQPDHGFNDYLEEYDPDNHPLTFSVTVSDGDNELFTFTSNEELIVGTYLSDIKQTKDIETDFGVEGVYLSKSYAEMIIKDHNISKEELNGKSITFELAYPVYNTYGRVLSESDETDLIEIDSLTVDHTTVTVPVAGILKGTSFGLTVNFQYSMFYERSILENALKDVNVKGRTLYVMDSKWKEFYVDEIPENETRQPDRIMTDTPWTPKAYTLVIDSVENVLTVAEELENMGFAAWSKGLTQSKVLVAVKKMNKVFTVVSVLFGILIVLFAAGTSYINKKNTQKIYRYFNSIGLRKREIRDILNRYYISNTKTTMIIVLICILFVTPFHYAFTRTIFKPSIFGILLSVLLCIICYYLIPMFVDRMKS